MVIVYESDTYPERVQPELLDILGSGYQDC